MLCTVLAHILVPRKTMHYHLLGTFIGFIWLVKVHVHLLTFFLVWFFKPPAGLTHAFTHFALYNVVDMLPLIQCFSADVQNGCHENGHAHRQAADYSRL